MADKIEDTYGELQRRLDTGDSNVLRFGGDYGSVDQAWTTPQGWSPPPEVASQFPQPEPVGGLKNLHDAVDSIPTPKVPLAYSLTEMFKDTAHSLLNLMEAGHGDKPVNIRDTLAVAGPEGVAGRFYPVGSLGVFGSRLNPKSSLYKKLNTELNSIYYNINSPSADPKKILLDTGLSKDINGNWVLEVDDSKARIKPMTPDLSAKLNSGDATLSDVMEHPQLFDAFPYLNNVKVQNKNLGEGSAAYYHNVQGPPKIELQASDNSNSMLDMLLHETQHAVNAHEKDYGFNKSLGANYDPQYIDSQIDRLDKVARYLVNTGDVAPTEANRLFDLLNSMKSHTDVYHANPGEVEAFNVEARRHLSALARREVMPTATESLPRSKQIDLNMFSEFYSRALRDGVIE